MDREQPSLTWARGPGPRGLSVGTGPVDIHWKRTIFEFVQVVWLKICAGPLGTIRTCPNWLWRLAKLDHGPIWNRPDSARPTQENMDSIGAPHLHPVRSSPPGMVFLDNGPLFTLHAFFHIARSHSVDVFPLLFVGWGAHEIQTLKEVRYSTCCPTYRTQCLQMSTNASTVSPASTESPQEFKSAKQADPGPARDQPKGEGATRL